MSSNIEDEDLDGLKVNLDYMAQIFNKKDGDRIPASGRRAPNIFSKTENLFFFIFHPSYIMNQVLNQKMSVNEIQEKCPNLLKTAKIKQFITLKNVVGVLTGRLNSRKDSAFTVLKVRDHRLPPALSILVIDLRRLYWKSVTNILK